MGGSPSGEDNAGIPTTKEEYEEAVGKQTTTDTSQSNYSTSSSLGADDDLYAGGFLGDEYDPKSTEYSDTGGYTTAGSSFSDDATGASGGWTPGDKVPSVGVVRNVTDFATGEVNQIYSIDGKNVTKEEFDANSAKRSSFVNQATNPNSPYHEEAFAAESLRTQNKDYRGDENKEEYEKTQGDASKYVEDQRSVTTKLSDLRSNEAFSKLPYDTQQKVMSGVASNNKEIQTQALRDFGYYVGQSEQQDKASVRAFIAEVLGANNVNNIKGFGQLSGQEYAKAIVDGLNDGSGFNINNPFSDNPLVKGVGGTDFQIQRDGTITVQSQGNQLLGTGVDVGLMYATAGASNAARLATGALKAQFGVTPLGDWVKGGGGNLGSNFNVSISPGNVVKGIVGNTVGSKILEGTAKEVYEQTKNKNLTIGSVITAKSLMDSGLDAILPDNLKNPIDITGKSYGNEEVTGSGGKGTKATVNVKDGVTSSIQTDLQAVDETGQDSDIDYTDSGFGSNLRSSRDNKYNDDDDGGSDNNYSDPLLNIKKTPLDVNTLQNFGTETTPLTLQNNDASLMPNIMNRGFGGRYLQRGRNRDTGSVTTRRASQRDVDRDKRRTGILFG